MTGSEMAVGIDGQLEANRRIAARLHWVAALPILVVAVVLGIFWWWVGVAAAVVGLLLVHLVAPRRADDAVLAAIGARSATVEEFPRYHNLVEGLSLARGVVEGDLYVLDESGCNALAVGPPASASIVLSTGLLDTLDRVALEGVVAELLVRIRSADAELGTRAAWFIAGRGLCHNGPFRRGPARSAALLTARWRAALLRRVLVPQREMLSDLAGVSMTRYPPGLEAALVAMSAAGTTIEAATWGTAHLWIADPFPPDVDDGGISSCFAVHDPIDQRIDLLREL